MLISQDNSNTTGYIDIVKQVLTINENNLLTKTIKISKLNLRFSATYTEKSVSINNTILQTVKLT